MVFITIPQKTNKITNIDNIGTNPVNMQETRKSGVYSQLNIFALDTAATKHICCDLSYFSNFKTCNKIVNWGKAKQISIKGYGNILIKSNINNKKYMLKDCLYMPELGINLISQSQLNKNYYSIFNDSYAYIKDNQNNLIIKGSNKNGLYILDIIPCNKNKNNLQTNTIFIIIFF